MTELLNDLEQLESLRETNIRAEQRVSGGATDYLDYAPLGYTIHNLYSVMENACLRIGQFFENSLSETAWHKNLLERMKLEIEGVRPPLLDKEAYLLLDDLRGFRHVFRNLYARPIDADKVMLVQGKVESAVTAFRAAVRSYIGSLRELAANQES